MALCLIKHSDNFKFTFYCPYFLLGIFWSAVKSTCKFCVEYFLCPLQMSLASYIFFIYIQLHLMTSNRRGSTDFETTATFDYVTLRMHV